MSDPSLGLDFGCGGCWPSRADAAWEARALLSLAAVLVDESHYIVRILECPNCTQRFISAFSETIDWSGGDDSQFWTLMPITAPEAADLARQGESLTEAKLAGLATTRRSLRRDYPTAAAPRIYWGTGAQSRW